MVEQILATVRRAELLLKAGKLTTKPGYILSETKAAITEGSTVTGLSNNCQKNAIFR